MGFSGPVFRAFDPENDGNKDVPDPYYGGAKGFEDVYRMIERTCPHILYHIKSHFLNI